MNYLLVRIHFIIVMIRWTGLAPWEFEFPFPGSLTSTFRRRGGRVSQNVSSTQRINNPEGLTLTALQVSLSLSLSLSLFLPLTHTRARSRSRAPPTPPLSLASIALH